MSYPDKEAKLWRKNRNRQLDKTIVKECANASDVVRLLSTETISTD